jgi:hypothetical protein
MYAMDESATEKFEGEELACARIKENWETYRRGWCRMIETVYWDRSEISITSHRVDSPRARGTTSCRRRLVRICRADRGT